MEADCITSCSTWTATWLGISAGELQRNTSSHSLKQQKPWKQITNRFLHSEFFGAGWAAMPPLHWLLLCLRVIMIRPGFIHGHQSRQKIIWIAPKKFQKLLRRLALLTFLIHIHAFRDPLRRELRHTQIFMNDGPNLLMWDAQLLSYWFSRNPAVFQD